MNAQLRINEALLIADQAFQPFQCIAWAPQESRREYSFSVIDRTSAALVDRCHLSSEQLSNPAALEAILTQARKTLRAEGFHLEPWQMPK